jgi:rhamnosyltransferase
MNRILLFVHYNKHDKVSDYIFYLLKNIRELFSRIVFISNSPLDETNYRLVTAVSDKIIIRKNRGFDFGAWKDAMFEETWDNLIQYDNVTLMNDSCFGPLYDMTVIYEKMEKIDVDFWGLTNHRKTKFGMPQTNRAIPEHIQSYFMCFHNTVLKSMVFRKFWDTIQYFDDVEKVIRCYETQLTALLFRCGFKYSVYFDTTIVDNIEEDYNIATLHPNLILKNNIPLLKIKSFIYFPLPGYIIDCIKNTTHYPVPLITEYFDQIYDPNINLALYDKSIIIDQKQEYQDYSSLKIAIHVHVYYVDLLHEFIAYFNTFNFIYDLYITTDSIEKKEAIDNLIANTLLNCPLKEIVIFENKGKDILPWLRLSNRLDRYDIVGHFHTKKTTQEKEWFGSIWRQELLGHLLLPIHLILNAFMDNTKIGVIIPEIPSCFHIFPEINLDEMGYTKKLNELWKKMGCRKRLSFDTLLTVIMPYGTMFWYRPNALKQLFDLNITSKDFPDESIPNNRTIAHCIERLIVYTAWNNDYDFRIVVSNHSYTNSFTDNMIFNKHVKSLKQSKIYRVGSIILFVPKKLKALLMNAKKM